MKPERPPDVVSLARVLHSHGIRWVLIGGMAMVVHGSAYVTTDMDLAIAIQSRNDPAIVTAFSELGAEPVRYDGTRPYVLDPKVLASPFMEFRSDFGSFHVLNRLPGVESFQALIDGAVWIEVDGVAIPVASIDDLIRMKSESTRPKDQAHLAELRELRESRPG